MNPKINNQKLNNFFVSLLMTFPLILWSGEILINDSHSSLLSEQPKSDVHAWPTVYR